MVSEIRFRVTDPDGCVTFVQTAGAQLAGASVWDVPVAADTWTNPTQLWVRLRPLALIWRAAGKAKSQPEGPLLWALPLALTCEIPSDCLWPQRPDTSRKEHTLGPERRPPPDFGIASLGFFSCRHAKSIHKGSEVLTASFPKATDVNETGGDIPRAPSQMITKAPRGSATLSRAGTGKEPDR